LPYWLINGEACFLYRFQSQNTIFTWMRGEKIFANSLIYWGLLHNRADIYTFSVNRADIFVCAMMCVVSLWQNIAFLYTWHVCMCWVRSAVVVPQWNGRPERTENLHPILFYPSKNQHLRLIKCLKKHFMMILWAECERLNGTSVSKVTRFQLRILNIYVTDCQIRLMKTWKKCAKLSMRKHGIQLTMFMTLLTCHMVHAIAL
jgi:hypothetical protein